MSKYKKKILIISIILIICLAGIIIYLNIVNKAMAVIPFQESKKEYANPDRGYYIQIDSKEAERLKKLKEEYRIVFLAVDLKEFTDRRIDKEKLGEIEACLKEARKYGISLIFRAAYSFDSYVEEPDNRELIGEHIKQLSDLINQYEDTIYCIQAGMLGPYGEWHSSRYLDEEDGERSKGNRLFLLREWENYLHKKLEMDVRRPRFIREAEKAGILIGRLGYHNDALLSTEDDMGSYDDPEYTREEELDWMKEHLLNRRNGGEMPIVSEWNDADRVIKEFSKMHIGYLNRGYNTEVFEKWKEINYKGQDLKDYIKKHIGYRIFLTELRCSQKTGNEKIRIQMSFQNTGFAPVPKEYHFYLVIQGKQENSIEEIEIESEQLFTICNEEKVTIQKEITLPKSFRNRKQGEELIIGLKIVKDAEEQQNSRGIQLANDGIEYAKAVNQLAMYQKTAFFWKLKENNQARTLQ